VRGIRSSRPGARPDAGGRASARVGRLAPKRGSVAKPATAPRASDAGRSRLGDLTRPIAIDRRITRRRRSTFLLGVVAVAIAGAIAAALFVLPVQTYFAQDETIAQRQTQLDQLDAVNAELQAEVDRLRTDDGVREAAREEIGFSEQGERRLTLLTLPDLPTDLPDGWPYGMIGDVIALRAAPPATPAAPPAAPPVSTSTPQTTAPTD
jgi:cell division protein FtsB